jgi:nucleoside diphosphate kinase
MGQELAFVLVNPYTIAKSRTGGVIARYCGRTDLHLVAARMFGPSSELAEEYAEQIRTSDPKNQVTRSLIADYVLKNYAPDPATGKRRRVLMLLFEGEQAVEKIFRVTGSVTMRWGSGESIRDTYGDYVLDEDGKVRYFEPAVLVATHVERCSQALRLWADHSTTDGGIVSSAGDVPIGSDVQRTLVLLKPDNFRFPSQRAGHIVDTLSTSGLRIVGAKKISMSVAQAEDFYRPVKAALAERFQDIGSVRLAEAAGREFGLSVPADVARDMAGRLSPLFAQAQFESIVEFMTGFRPSQCAPEEKATKRREECLALVYEGYNAIAKIRDILGPTDPSKARPGSVRREFGRDIMVNAAHASDSPESAERELGILKVDEDNIVPIVERYYGAR